MTNIAELNQFANVNIHFLTSDFLKLNKFKELDLYNLIFTKSGVYNCLNLKWGYIISKNPNIKYNNIMLEELDIENNTNLISFYIPKPKEEMLNDILKCFRYINNKIKSELMIILYYDTLKKEYIFDILSQMISGASVKYIYTDEYEMNDRYIKFLEIHSHHTMGANFSSTDDRDESTKPGCVYGVIGSLRDNSYDSKFRVYDGTKFITLDITNVFDIKEKKNTINMKHKLILDNILDEHKKQQEISITIPTGSSNFPQYDKKQLERKEVEVSEFYEQFFKHEKEFLNW